MSARDVIARLGGMRKLSQLLGHQNHTTVQGWWDRDVIPARRQAELLQLAKREGVPITAEDLILRDASPSSEAA
jgi:hypothetical protein